jgi:hypothetical protein
LFPQDCSTYCSNRVLPFNSFYGVLDNSGGENVVGIACLMGSKRR